MASSSKQESHHFRVEPSCTAPGRAFFHRPTALSRTTLRIACRVASCVSVRWGSYAQALAIMRSIQAAVDRPERYDRYVLLSGQDYPIVPRWCIDQSFRDDPQSEYIEA
jgi:hypothetical protein